MRTELVGRVNGPDERQKVVLSQRNALSLIQLVQQDQHVGHFLGREPLKEPVNLLFGARHEAPPRSRASALRCNGLAGSS